MSTPISEAVRLAGLASLALLAACATRLEAPDRANVRVLGERVTVVAPPGLCVDPRALDVTRAGGVMLLADCAAVSGAGTPGFPGAINVNVTTGDLPGSLEALEAFLTGPGLSALGRSGDPEAVSVLARSRTDEALYIKVRDTGPQLVAGAEPEFWRVFFRAGQRLVSASVTAFPGAGLSEDAQQRALAALVVATQAANAAPAEAPQG